MANTPQTPSGHETLHIGQRLLAALTHNEIAHLLDGLLGTVSPDMLAHVLDQLQLDTRLTVQTLLIPSDAADTTQDIPPHRCHWPSWSRHGPLCGRSGAPSSTRPPKKMAHTSCTKGLGRSPILTARRLCMTSSVWHNRCDRCSGSPLSTRLFRPPASSRRLWKPMPTSGRPCRSGYILTTDTLWKNT